MQYLDAHERAAHGAGRYHATNGGVARARLMTAATRQAAWIGFHEFKPHRREAAIQPANTASIAPVRRCGFRWEGLARELLCVDGKYVDGKWVDGKWVDGERWALLDRAFDAQ